MAYDLSEINFKTVSDPRGLIEEGDAIYHASVETAAEKIADNIKNSPIVLLSGPSGSGKTTTAMKVSEALERRGVRSHYVGMDDYFNTVSPETGGQHGRRADLRRGSGVHQAGSHGGERRYRRGDHRR